MVPLVAVYWRKKSNQTYTAVFIATLLTKRIYLLVYILKDLEFTSSRQSLKASRKMLKKQGKGDCPQAVMSLSNEDIVANWCTGLFESRTFNVWFLVYYRMGMRGRDEPKKYCFGDFTI